MSQELIAGIGNIYRAEILFKAGVHPEQPALTLTREEFDRLWLHSVDLLQRGFVSGSILTVDAADAQQMGKPWTRRYVYNHTQCGRCKGVSGPPLGLPLSSVSVCETTSKLPACWAPLPDLWSSLAFSSAAPV
jgi:hypothetical protein